VCLWLDDFWFDQDQSDHTLEGVVLTLPRIDRRMLIRKESKFFLSGYVLIKYKDDAVVTANFTIVER
jgi:hypothetical protein